MTDPPLLSPAAPSSPQPRSSRCCSGRPLPRRAPTVGRFDGPKNVRVAAKTPHSVTLAWDAAVSSGSSTYVIEASGVPQTQTSYTWTRDMIPGRAYSFVMWAGDGKRETAKSNTVTVTLPVDTTPSASPSSR